MSNQASCGQLWCCGQTHSETPAPRPGWGCCCALTSWAARIPTVTAICQRVDRPPRLAKGAASLMYLQSCMPRHMCDDALAWQATVGHSRAESTHALVRLPASQKEVQQSSLGRAWAKPAGCYLLSLQGAATSGRGQPQQSAASAPLALTLAP